MNFPNVSLIFAIVLGASHSRPAECQPRSSLCSTVSSLPFGIGCSLGCVLSGLTGLTCSGVYCDCDGNGRSAFSFGESKASSCDLHGNLVCDTVCSSLLFDGGSTCNDEGCFCNGTSTISPPPPNSFTCDEACEEACELYTLGTGKCNEKRCVCS